MQGIIEGSRMLGSAGESFVNSFQKGLQMSMAVEKNKRQKQIDNLTLIKNAQDEIDLVTQKYGEEAGQSYAQTLNKSLSSILGDNNELSLQGVQTYLYNEDKVNYQLNEMGLTDTPESREVVKSFLENIGVNETDPIIVNTYTKTNTGKVDWEGTLKLGETGRSIQAKKLDNLKEAGKEFQTKFLQDSLIKKYQTIDGEINKASDMIELASKGNPISSETIKQIMPRLAGEVGNLTAQEQQAYGGSSAIKSRLEQIAKRWAKGTITDENIKYLREITDSFSKSNKRNYKNRATQLVDSYVKAGLISREYGLQIISSFISISEDSTITEKDPMGLGI